MSSKLRKLSLTGFALLSLFAYNNCGKGGFETATQGSLQSVSGARASTPLPIVGNETNVMPIKIGCGYVNQPCVSVTICSPGTDTCQTIPNILLDTGSYGLRVFSSLVTVGLTATTVNGGTLSQCVSYADGSSDWGPVKKADVILGKERAANVPIQIIDSTFAGLPTDCTKPDASPNSVGFNGILGVGLFVEDCGPGCTTIANNRIYYACTGTVCVPSTATLAQQVSNPVAFLPLNNNGTALQLPDIPQTGAADVNGYLVLGIGTQKNNTPVDAQVFHTDALARITTDFNGKNYSSFIDSGSYALFFPGPDTLTACDAKSGADGFYCPTVVTSFTAVQNGAGGSPRVSVGFQIRTATAALDANNPNLAFSNLGGSFPGYFDWGLPFFYGRTVYNGIQGRPSSLGLGPYWAY
jgi:hypothetical protein